MLIMIRECCAQQCCWGAVGRCCWSAPLYQTQRTSACTSAYCSLPFTATARLAGIVHGVVVQMAIAAPSMCCFRLSGMPWPAQMKACATSGWLQCCGLCGLDLAVARDAG